MSKWLIKLAGNPSTLKELAKTFNSNSLKDLMISFDEEGGYYILQSTRFEGIGKPIDIYHESLAVVEELNGPIKFAVGYAEPIRVANVIEIKADGAKQEYGYGDIKVTLPKLIVDMTISINGGSPIEISQAASVPKLLELQRENENVRKAFDVYKKENSDWRDLYVLYEIIQVDIGGNPYTKGWITKTDEDLFTQTANHYRHGPKKGKKGKEIFKLPLTPMGLERAKELIEKMFNKWINSKLT